MAVLAGSPAAPSQESLPRFGGQLPPEVDAIYEKGLAWLVQAQDESGSWRDNQSGAGVDGICVMAFLASGDDPNFGRYAAVTRRGLQAIIAAQDPATGYLPSSMYHHGFAMLALAEAYGAVDDALLWEDGTGPEGRSLGQSLDLATRLAVAAQGKNRWGGWRYTPDSTDADTSVTGAVLMGLLAARNAGIAVPDESIEAAMAYMRRSTGRSGFVAYSGGFGGMGESMNRSAIAALVGAVSRQTDTREYQAALGHISARLDHREGDHYLEYFRYYMAQALFQGNYEAWEKWNAAAIRQIQAAQRDDGSINGGAYHTAMSLLALALNYRFLPIYER